MRDRRRTLIKSVNSVKLKGLAPHTSDPPSFHRGRRPGFDESDTECVALQSLKYTLLKLSFTLSRTRFFPSHSLVARNG